MMQKKMWKTTAVILAAALVLTGCDRIKAVREGMAAKKTETPAAPPETVYAVSTYRASPGNLDEYLEFGGDVEPASSVDIYPEASGKLLSLRVKAGDRVAREQMLAQVDPSRPGMNYAPSPIRAPTGGTVTSFPFPVGTTVSPAMSIGKISSANDLEITIAVAERFVSRIRMGQSGVLVFDAYPGETFAARVVEISPVLNTVSRTMSVKLRLTSPDARIKIGMYARVRLVTDERRNVIVIPNDAVVRRAAGSVVFVLNQDDADPRSVRRVPVTEGIRVDDALEILAGLAMGDEIVVKGQTLLDDGSKVNIISTQEGAK
jgi:multidrug efflux pump subunit AcrA (membrane-fusion protein)